jgi:FkbM family methyltransferase
MSIGDLIRKLTPRKLREVLAYSDFDEYSRKVYSQEGEDLLLSRIFDHQPKGFYVDCGAHHPFRFSNTKLLYDKGWRGINIEPNPEVSDLFKRYRPNDMYCGVGVSEQKGTIPYYVYGHPALNTFDEAMVKSRSEKPIKQLLIETTPLAELLNQNLPPNTSIDLLTIDVEGFDLKVLKSNDWAKYPPNFIFVESNEITLEEVLISDLNKYLVERQYELVSKLWKSCLYMRVDINSQ